MPSEPAALSSPMAHMPSCLGQSLYPLHPQPRERVWGGQRLLPHNPPIGEIWSAFEGSVIATGIHAGLTVGEVARAWGAELLGEDVAARFPSRFPLLVKLLDCADWLSVQVHPDDEQAACMVGAGAFGKTEAWHFLEADAGATILAGTKPGTTATALVDAIRTGAVLDVSQSHAVTAGETYFLPARTLHALGPGLLVYEVQQASDTTYRVYDWDRPACHGRDLHIEESVAVVDVQKTVVPVRVSSLRDEVVPDVVACPFFALDLLHVSSPIASDTKGQTFHVLTVTAGAITVTCGAETLQLRRHETAIVAGAAGVYRVHAAGECAAVVRTRVGER